MRSFFALIISVVLFLPAIAQNSTENLEFAQQKLQERGEFFFSFTCDSPELIQELDDFLWFDKQRNTTFYAYATQEAFDLFLTYGLSFQPVYSYYEQDRALTMATTTAQMTNWDRYPTHAVYIQMLDDFASDYPELCRVELIGYSENGLPIKTLVISDNVNTDEDEPEFWWSGTMHGDETTGYVLLLRLADYLLSNYGTDTQVTNLVNEIEIYINPLANPDGTFNGSAGLDNVSSATRANSNNVDLNRNFPTLNGDSYTLQSEIQCMMDYSAGRDFVMSCNTHGGIELMNHPWDTWQSWENIHPDNDWWVHVGFVYADQVELDAPSTYFEGPGSMNYGSYNSTGVTHGADWYYAIGSRQDYMNYYRNCREITLELSDTKTLGTENLNTYWGYNKQAMLDYTEQVLYGLRGVVTDACSGSALTDVKIEIVGHDQDNTEVYSSAPAGNYHRPAYEGTYDFTFSLSGYHSQTHTVTLTNDVSTRLDIQLVPNNVASPDFSADATSVFEGTTVNFTDVSSGTVSSYSWTLTGGTPDVSIEQNPSVTYNSAGTYDVELEIISQGCTISELKTDYITVAAPAAPVADFEADATNVSIGATVNFTDLSANVPNAWNWTFTGGTPSSSTDQNPSIVYNTPGVFEVSLEASNAYGNDTETKTAYITVVESDIVMQNGSVTQCGGTFYDAGSTAAYSNNENYELTIYPSTPGSFVQVEFTMFDVEPNGADCYDYLSIYDGENTSATQIGEYCGTDHTVIGTGGTVTSTDASGALTFVFYSDGGVTQEGWEATVSCYSPNDPPTADFSAASVTTCTGEIQFVDESSLANTWSWDFGDGNNSNEQHPLHTYAADGTYTVTLSVTNDFGNDEIVKTDYITVDKPDAPVVVDAESCGPASLTLTATGDGTLNWYDAAIDGSLLSSGSDYTTNFNETTTVYVESAITAPQYSAGLSDNLGDGGFYTSANAHGLIFNADVDFTLRSVKVYADGAGNRTVSLLDNSDAVIASTTINIPDGESRINLDFSVPAGTGYKLMGPESPDLHRNGGTTAPTLAYPFEVAGVLSIYDNTADNLAYYYYFYDWDVKVGEDCVSARTPATATIHGLPTVDLGEDQEVCDGNSFTFDAGMGFSNYAWTPSGSAQTFVASSTGSYAVTVEDVNGCTATDNANLTVNPNPTVSFTSIPENGNDGDGSITAIGADGQAPYAYTWDNSATGGTISNLEAGTYCVTVEDANSCTVSDCELLTSTSPSPIAGFEADVMEGCGSLTVQFTDLSTNAPTSWSWDFGDGNSSSEQNPAHTYSSSGVYTVSLTVENTFGVDQEIKNDFILLYDLLVVSDLAVDLSCYGDDNGLLPADVTGGEGTYSYQWENESGVVIGSEETLNNLMAGNYYLTVTDAAGCSDNGVYVISQPTELTLSLDVVHESIDGACDGSITPIVDGGTAGYTYSFMDESGAIADLDDLCDGEYYVTVTDMNNCEASGSAVVNPGAIILTPDFSADQTEGCEDLTVQFTDLSVGGAVSWEWSFGDGATSTEQNPEHTYYNPGLYTVELTVENASSESESIIKTDFIHVKDRPGLNFYIVHETSASASDGEVTVVITGDDFPYNIDWSNGEETETISGLSGGYYSVAVTGANGCPATGVAEVQTLTGILTGDVSETVLYPNPVRSVLNVESSVEITMLTVYSVDGRVLNQMSPQALQFTLEMPETSGVYIISLDYVTGQSGKYRVVVE